MEQYSDEELGLCVIVLATFVHREPAAAAPMLPALLHNVTRFVILDQGREIKALNINITLDAIYAVFRTNR